LDQAIADYTRALQLDPQNWLAQYNRAELLDKSGKPKEALEAYQSFLKSAPSQEKDSIDRARERIKALGK
jgi:tetratricopeptide (TPR) repeat protein